jgi:hypothetical protein
VWISVEEKDCYYGFPVYGEVHTMRLPSPVELAR